MGSTIPSVTGAAVAADASGVPTASGAVALGPDRAPTGSGTADGESGD